MLAACNDHRYRAVILLAYEAGLRAGEIRGLHWGDILDGLLTVRRALDKETGQVQLMAHEELSTTMRYIDVGEADKRAAMAAVFGQKNLANGGSDAAAASESAI